MTSIDPNSIIGRQRSSLLALAVFAGGALLASLVACGGGGFSSSSGAKRNLPEGREGVEKPGADADQVGTPSSQAGGSSSEETGALPDTDALTSDPSDLGPQNDSVDTGSIDYPPAPVIVMNNTGGVIESGTDGSGQDGSGIALDPAGGGIGSPNAGANGGASQAGQGAGEGASTPPPPSTPAPPPPPQTPAQKVADACATRQRKSRSVSVKFEANTTKQCPFVEKDGNETMKGSKLRARLEWTRGVDIPPNHIVCSMDVRSPSQKMRFDDHLFLMLNNRVLMTRASAINALPDDSIGFKRYDWLQLRNQSTGDRGSPYCPSGMSCSMPKTENTGIFSFSFNDDARNRLFGELLGKNLEFRLVVTGDDNPDSDCMFDRNLDLSVNYSYVE